MTTMTRFATDQPSPDDETQPARVHDYTADGLGKRAAVTHPSGEFHPNAELTRKRLMARGYAIVPVKPTHTSAPR